MKYYRLNNIHRACPNATYYMIFGERSNGKTYAVIEKAMIDFVKTGKQFAIIRRWSEDIKGSKGASMLDNLICNQKGVNTVKKLTKGKFDAIVYRSRQWFLAYMDPELNKMILDNKPCAYAFALTEYEHYKGNSYPKVKTILFDEFMTKESYIPDEFINFNQVLSTIIRSSDDVTIYMCANTVSLYCPYFKEMGITNVRRMKPGDIDLYNYGNSELKVAVEYTEAEKEGKPSDKYFAFDNPKLKMITEGKWQIDIYPHIRSTFKKKDILFTYFVIVEEHILQCEIVNTNNMLFTYVHKKTSEIKDYNKDVIFKVKPDQNRNIYTNLIYPVDELTKKITFFYRANKVFYQSNDIGEIMNHYLNTCRKVIR